MWKSCLIMYVISIFVTFSWATLGSTRVKEICISCLLPDDCKKFSLTFSWINFDFCWLVCLQLFCNWTVLWWNWKCLVFLQIFINKKNWLKNTKKSFYINEKTVLDSRIINNCCWVVDAYLTFFLQFDSQKNIFGLKIYDTLSVFTEGVYFSIWYQKISTEKLWGPNSNYAT